MDDEKKEQPEYGAIDLTSERTQAKGLIQFEKQVRSQDAQTVAVMRAAQGRD